MPRITVLLPVRDQASLVGFAIKSILQQRWHDFQLLVLDDGSQDGSGDIAASLQDPRVVVQRSDRPVGLPKILNKGLMLSDSEYVARMDADDWSHPRRLSAQIGFLDGHRDIAACGTAVRIIMPDGERRLREYPTTHEAIRARLLFENALAHPAAMVRRASLEQFGICYDSEYPKSEDYDLWERLSGVALLANLKKPYLDYHIQSHGADHSRQQRQQADQIRWRQLEVLGVRPTESQWELHRALCVWDTAVIGPRASELEDWLQQLIDANRAASVYQQVTFREEVLARFRSLCRLMSRCGVDGWSFWHNASKLRGDICHVGDYLRLPMWYRARMAAKAKNQ